MGQGEFDRAAESNGIHVKREPLPEMPADLAELLKGSEKSKD
jgi:hypothetical protein